MKIYFAGSIRGGREKVEEYKKIIALLSAYGTVLTEHIGDSSVGADGQIELTDQQIYTKDIHWINEADVVVAEVTVTSLGVGYEIGYAEGLGKRIICLYQPSEGKRLSAMLSGNQKIEVIEYQSVEELRGRLSLAQ